MGAGAELERVEEHKKLLLFGRAKLLEAPFHLSGFACVPFNRAFQAQRPEVVHESRPHPQSPKRGRAQLVPRICRASLNGAVTRPDVVQQVVSIRMNGLVSKGVWNRESAAVDYCAGRRSYDGCHMTRTAADPGEDHLPSLRVVSCGERHIAGVALLCRG
jgi:hypothetical protein